MKLTTLTLILTTTASIFVLAGCDKDPEPKHGFEGTYTLTHQASTWREDIYEQLEDIERDLLAMPDFQPKTVVLEYNSWHFKENPEKQRVFDRVELDENGFLNLTIVRSEDRTHLNHTLTLRPDLSGAGDLFSIEPASARKTMNSDRYLIQPMRGLQEINANMYVRTTWTRED